MKTTLHTYWFDISKPEEAKAYEALVNELKRTPGRGKWLHVIADSSKITELLYNEGQVELDIGTLFGNQWNSDKGRVFDWYEGIYPNKHIKTGHYLDITEEMIAVRHNRYACGYCGHQTDTPEGEFHRDCIDSEYLLPKQLFILRYRRVDGKLDLPGLTPEEEATLLPLYLEAQRMHLITRLEKDTLRVEQEAENLLRRNKLDTEVALWLISNISRDLVTEKNVIYYQHKDTFSFGWRESLGSRKRELEQQLREKGFPFKFEVK